VLLIDDGVIVLHQERVIVPEPWLMNHVQQIVHQQAHGLLVRGTHRRESAAQCAVIVLRLLLIEQRAQKGINLRPVRHTVRRVFVARVFGAALATRGTASLFDGEFNELFGLAALSLNLRGEHWITCAITGHVTVQIVQLTLCHTVECHQSVVLLVRVTVRMWHAFEQGVGLFRREQVVVYHPLREGVRIEQVTLILERIDGGGEGCCVKGLAWTALLRARTRGASVRVAHHLVLALFGGARNIALGRRSLRSSAASISFALGTRRRYDNVFGFVFLHFFEIFLRVTSDLIGELFS
jgi:hypothetical protein